MTNMRDTAGLSEELLTGDKQQLQATFGQNPGTRILVTEYQAGLLSEGQFDQAHNCQLERDNGKYKDGQSRMGVKDAIYALVCTAIGAGVLTLPYALAQSGLIAGTLILLGIGVLSSYAGELLVAASKRTGMTSYGTLARATCGKWAELLTLACIAITTWLVMGSYMIVMADMMVPVLEWIFPGITEFAGGYSALRLWIQVLSLVVVFPYCLRDNMSGFKLIAVLSIVAMLALTAAVVILSIIRIIEKPVQWVPPAEPSETVSAVSIKYFSGTSSFLAISISSVSYLCHFNILPVVVEEMRAPTKSRSNEAIRWTMVSVAIMYVAFAVFGYLYAYDMPGGVSGDILLNFPSDSILVNIVRIALFLTLDLSYPLLVLPCYQSLESLVTELRGYEVGHSRRSFSSKLWNVAEILLLCVTSLACAIAVPHIQVVFAFLGSTVCNIIAFVLPPLFFVNSRPAGSALWNRRNASAVLLFALGVFLVITCTGVQIAIINQLLSK
ncbi:hypothetical protein FOL46_005219 [Perkinsus olseni]|uniref:Amino acid transporter transmembrane domain-containing protein n=1 Tax=Perkinsus olseni TaxID=32597 RepID=A0A7J6LTE3_PEROL|nr:hypothetical protein FOL46_005219 [Perkinsus olseni]